MMARIEGQVTGIDFFQPNADDKRKPHQLVMVMQSDGKKSEVIKVKDYNLQSRYDMFQTFSSLCAVKEWAFLQKGGGVNAGVSVTVTGGELMLAPGGSSGSGKDGMPLDLTDRVE